MAEIKLQADDTRIATIKFEDGAGANKDVTIPKAGGLLNVLTQGTAVAATGTAIDFTGIPSTAKRITVMFSDISCGTTGSLGIIQIGDGSFVTTGYKSQYWATAGSGVITGGLITLTSGGSAGYQVTGVATLLLQGSVWVHQAAVGFTNTTSNGVVSTGVAPALATPLDRIRFTTIGGATFTNGTINIMWE